MRFPELGDSTLIAAAALAILVSAGCGSDEEEPLAVVDLGMARDATSDAGTRPTDDGIASDMIAADTGSADTGDDFPVCTDEPCPIPITSFPYRHSASTSDSVNRFDSYPSCAIQDESGPEVAYVFRVSTPGTFVAGITDSAGTDVDIHLLDGLAPDRCLRRNDKGVSAHLDPGLYYLVVDSFVGASGTPADGPYELYADFLADDSPCAMVGEEIERIGTDELLPMPATGRVVLEAHLVTEDEFPDAWPTGFTDGIAEHYALSEAASGYVMERSEPWAPCCEPSNEFGQGSSARPPAIAEAWYINMRWRSAPTRGERYIVFNPTTGEAVVAAAGYENGPGDTTRIGGACEEIHDVLGTGHLGTLTFGVAVDQTLPYGPINCR